MSQYAQLTVRRFVLSCALVATVVTAAACGATAQLPVTAGTGANPVLPQPEKAPIPLVKVADAKGWTGEEHPITAEGTVVTAFARGLDHPRSLHVLPNGDVLVAETNAPVRPDDSSCPSWSRVSGDLRELPALEYHRSPNQSSTLPLILR
jgi:glucose/arabinose dehydrogenase